MDVEEMEDNLPSIIYTSDDSADNIQSDDYADLGQSDDSADLGQSDDSADLGQSDDSGDALMTGANFLHSNEPSFIAQHLCPSSVDDDAHHLLLDVNSDTGSCAPSPAIVPDFLHNPLMNGNFPCSGPEDITESEPTTILRKDLCGIVVDLSDSASQMTGASNQQLYLPDSSSGGVGSRSPSPSDSSSQSLGSQQEALGLLSLHQYQPLGLQQQQPPQHHTSVHYAHLSHDHNNITTKLTSGSRRWLVADVNIDARYKDAFYVQWNWRKIRNSCALLNFGILLALLIVGVALLVQMPQGHDCDPSREWWQGHVSYHILVPSFKDSNGDGVGDLQGVVTKLDYIQELGVSIVRLAPVFERAESYYGSLLKQPADPVPHPRGPPLVAWNLTRVVPNLGSGGEVQLLAALLHERGIKLLLDLPLAPGIVTTDVSVPGVSAPLPALPSSVVVSAAVVEASRAMRYWLFKGVDGFVMTDLHQLATYDSNELIVEACESWRVLLDDNPRVGHQQRVLVLPTKLIHALQQHNDAVDAQVLDMEDGSSNDTEVVEEETFTLAERALRAAHLLEEQLELTGSPADVMKQVEKALQLSSSPVSPWILWSMCGVGRPRVTKHAAHAPKPIQHHNFGLSQDIAASEFWSSVGRNLLLLFLPGSTSLYYGDEIDVAGPVDMKDLSWAGIMAWGGDNGGSFSSQEPWLPLDPGYQWRNVQDRNLTSVAATATMVKTKQEQPPLFINGLFNYEGDFHPTKASNYKVRYMDETLLIMDRFYPRRQHYAVVANLGHSVVQRDLSRYYYGGSVLASSHFKAGYVKFRSLSLQPSEVLVIVLDK